MINGSVNLLANAHFYPFFIKFHTGMVIPGLEQAVSIIISMMRNRLNEYYNC